MQIINILTFYILLVLFCVLFNLFFLEYKSYYVRCIENRRKYWLNFFKKCIKNKNYEFTKREIQKIKNPLWATAFLEEYEYRIKLMPKIRKIVLSNKKHFVKLLSSKKSNEHNAFFSYLISKLNMKKDKEFIESLALNMFTKTYYGRENALKALVSFATEDVVTKVFNELSKKEIYHNDKLLKQHIISFNGNKRELLKKLMVIYENLIDCYKIAIINSLNELEYFNFNNKLVKNIDNENNEVKKAIINLISKRQTKNTVNKLIDLLNSENIEISKRASQALSNVNTKEVKNALIKALEKDNIELKNAVSKSLIVLNISLGNVTLDNITKDIYEQNYDLLKGE